MAVKLKVTYADGRVEDVVVPPRAQVMTERLYSGLSDEAHEVEVSYHLAWASLQVTGRETNDFETWLNTIVEVEQVKKVEERPTPEAQPTTT